MIEEITSPPFLDDTAQEMVTKLQAIANNINNNAGQVSYSNTTSHLQAETVQTAIDEVKGITDTISASLTQLIISRTYSALYSITADGSLNITDTDLNMSAISGYELLSIGEFNTGNSGVYARRITFPTAQNNTVLALRNIGSARNDVTVTITFNYIKTFN